MRIVYSIPGISKAKTGDELLQRLYAIHPEGNKMGGNFSFSMSLPADDPRTKQILTLLESEGFAPYDSATPEKKDKVFILNLLRRYDEHDLVEASYLSLDAATGSWEDGRTDDGVLKLNCEFLKTDIEEQDAEILAWDSNCIVSNRVKGLLEESVLIGWRLSPTRLRDGPQPDEPEYETEEWDKVGGPWWELWSDTVLPPLNREKNSVTDYRENPIPPESDKSVGYIREIREPSEANVLGAEFHFKRSEIERMPPFDVAALHERMGKWPSDRYLVVSHRFRNFLTEHSVKGATYAPIRIDPD